MASNRTDLARKSAPLLTERYEVMFPTVLPRAIQIAAERALMTPAEYVRRAVIDNCCPMELTCGSLKLLERVAVFPRKSLDGCKKCRLIGTVQRFAVRGPFAFLASTKSPPPIPEISNRLRVSRRAPGGPMSTQTFASASARSCALIAEFTLNRHHLLRATLTQRAGKQVISIVRWKQTPVGERRCGQSLEDRGKAALAFGRGDTESCIQWRRVTSGGRSSNLMSRRRY
jgi:hypothetical protein